jgi:hypothetical protein
MTALLAVRLLVAVAFAVPHAASVPAGPARVAPVRLIVETAPAAGKRRDYLGSEGEAAIKAGVEAAAGQARKLESDGASAIFATHAYLEASPEAAPALTRSLEAAGLRVTPLADALEAIATAPAAPAASDADLLEASKKVYDNEGTALQQSDRFGALLSAVETADLSKMSAETRREAAGAIHSGLVAPGNAFNAIRGDQKQSARQRFLDAHPNKDYQYVDMERAAIQETQAPQLKAQVEPIRQLTVRAILALDRLGGPIAERMVLDLLGHAEYAGLERLAADPALKLKYVRAWLLGVAGSLRETVQGLARAPEKDDGWSGSRRSGGYENVEGRRNAMHLYKWERFRGDPADSRAEIGLLLGLPSPELPMAETIAEALAAMQNLVPAIDAINKQREVSKKVEQSEASIRRFAESRARRASGASPSAPPPRARRSTRSPWPTSASRPTRTRSTITTSTIRSTATAWSTDSSPA